MLYAFCEAKFLNNTPINREIKDNPYSHRHYYYFPDKIVTSDDRVEIHLKIYNSCGFQLNKVLNGDVERYVKVYKVQRKYSPTMKSKTYKLEAENDEAEYIAGDPRLLRDSSNGQFGSYPSFEGDDEEE